MTELHLHTYHGRNLVSNAKFLSKINLVDTDVSELCALEYNPKDLLSSAVKVIATSHLLYATILYTDLLKHAPPGLDMKSLQSEGEGTCHTPGTPQIVFRLTPSRYT